MTKIYRIVCQLSLVLGLLSILAAVLVKLLHLEARVATTSHTAFIVASAFFLCSLATRERAQSTLVD